MDLNKLISLTYIQFVKELKDEAANHKISALIDAGLDDGFPDDEKIQFSKGSITASNLIPMQKQLILEKSLKYFLEGKSLEILPDILSGVPVAINQKAIVTLNKKYIVDGHHGWVESVLVNPNSRVEIYDITLNIKPIEVLKVIQLSIATLTTKIPFSENIGTNLFKINENTFKKYVENNVNDKVLSLMNKDIKSLSDYLWGNILLLRKNNKPIKNAPDRIFMPQVSKAKGWDKKLKNGEINFKQPFKNTNELMNHLSFTEFLLEKQIATLRDEIEIEIDIDTTKHAEDRKSRHGDDNLISNEDIIATVNMAMDEIAERQFKGLDSLGRKYWIHDKDNFNLNIIAQFTKNKDKAVLRIITVMRKKDFKGSSDTYKITI